MTYNVSNGTLNPTHSPPRQKFVLSALLRGGNSGLSFHLQLHVYLFIKTSLAVSETLNS